jgi:hypothetical protein
MPYLDLQLTLRHMPWYGMEESFSDILSAPLEIIKIKLRNREKKVILIKKISFS